MNSTAALFVHRRRVALLASGDNPQGIVRQWPLQCRRFAGRAYEPCSHSSAVVKSTGMALAWIGRTTSIPSSEREQLMLAGFAFPLARP
jgi:hypothetical protein